MAISWAYPIGQFFFLHVHEALPGRAVRRRLPSLCPPRRARGLRRRLVSGPSSRVAWTLETVRAGARRRRRHGAKLHKDCSDCHGAAGNIDTPDVPDLAGQNPLYTYKQLADYKAEPRASPIMNDAVAESVRPGHGGPRRLLRRAEAAASAAKGRIPREPRP